MSYLVRSGSWLGSSLASSTPVALLTTAQVKRMANAAPGWTSATESGGVFTLYGSQLQAAVNTHTVVLTVETGGPLGTMAVSYTVDGGAVQGPFTSAVEHPNGPLSAAFWALAIAGTPVALNFVDVTFPLSAVFTLVPCIEPFQGFTATGLGGADPLTFALPDFGPPVPAPLSTVTLAVTTLADAAPGALVFIESDVGQGWTVGTVVSDGTNTSLNGTIYPNSTRAVGGLVGYPPAANPDPTSYTLNGASASGNETWFQGRGATFYGGALSTLGAVAGLCLVETTPGGPWVARTV